MKKQESFKLRAWPIKNPFIREWQATSDDIDEFGHVNNVRYIHHALEVAWAHSNKLGFSIETYKRIGVGCVVWRHEFDYLTPVLLGEEVEIATWISENDARIRLVRCFEMRKKESGLVVLKGQTKFVCVDMASGRPARMPKAFIEAYKIMT